MNKCELCGNYPANMPDTPIYGYHRKKFFKVTLQICDMCFDGVYSFWDGMNSGAQYHRLAETHPLKEVTLKEVMGEFTYTRGTENVLEASLAKFLNRVGYLIGVSKKDIQLMLKQKQDIEQ